MNGFLRAISGIAVGACALAIQGCGGGGGGYGGGGGGSNTPTFSVSPGTISFNAASPTASPPAPQIVTGTVSGSLSGTLYVVIGQTTGPTPPIAEITAVTVNGSSGQATVTPRAPDVLGTGSYSGTISVRACLNDVTCATGELAGSPRTINVSYSVGAVATPPNSVMPHIAVAGRSGDVVIRGSGLNNTTSVRFGAANAASFTVVSDTEVHATYPALTAGPHAVSLTPNTGAGGTIVAVAPTTYTEATLLYPESAALGLRFLLYDAERQALLVGGSFFGPGGNAPLPNKLWRFTYSGGAWSAPTTTPIDTLNDAEWSPDGSRVIAVAEAGVLELSPDALSTLRTVPKPDPQGSRLDSIAIANDGLALISFGSSPPEDGMYYYSVANGTYTRMGLLFREVIGRKMIGTLDGSRVFGSISAISPSQPLLDYTASTGRRSFTVATDQTHPMAVSANANRIVVHERGGLTPYGRVYPSDYSAPFTPMGTLPGWESLANIDLMIRAVIVDREGKRAYVLRVNSQLHTYDIRQPPAGGGAFPELGTPITVTVPDDSNQTSVQTAITPDGNTLFFAGRNGLVVVPAPSPAN